MNYKLYVMNEEQSRQAQEKAFRMGYKWGTYSTNILNASHPFLYFHSDKNIGFDHAQSILNFRNSKATEITFDQWMNMEEPRKRFKAEGILTGVTNIPIDDYSVLTFKVKGLSDLHPSYSTQYKIKELK